jgi:ankyrin repeat protein
MNATRFFHHGVLSICLVALATPTLARTSRDPLSRPQGRLSQDLFQAIRHRDLAGVQSLLARGADANARNSLESTALSAAAATGQVPIVEALLRAGAKLDASTPYGTGTALAAAAATGSVPVVKLLLARGADVQAARPDGVTVLMYAALNGSEEIVRELLRRKVDVNAKDNDGATALIDAARGDHPEAGRLLLSSGASIDAADRHGWTALMNAAVYGHADFIKLLVGKGANPNAREGKGRTALILAAMYGDNPAVIQALVEGGADLQAIDARHRTALALATERGHEATAALLRERSDRSAALPGAVPAATSGAGRTPRAALQVSLAALQRSMGEFHQLTGCVSCHQHGLGRMVTGVAQQHGWAIGRPVERAQVERISAYFAERRLAHLKALQDPGAMKDVPGADIGNHVPNYGFMLAGMAAHRQPANEAAAAATMFLARLQLPDGRWRSPSPRRGPMQSSDFTMTALAVQAMQTYAPKDRGAEVADRLRRARNWLLTAAAETSEDKAFRLLGLKWAGASLADRQTAIEALRADQRPDGGWPQPGAPESDAYGTGQALYALRLGGELPATDPVYQRGVQFLLRTQEEDGSWFVPKRVEPRNLYFDAAFPHGEAQYASFNATCWATLALLQTIDNTQPGLRRAGR